jgi:Secretion system C-terminal sorting domain
MRNLYKFLSSCTLVLGLLSNSFAQGTLNLTSGYEDRSLLQRFVGLGTPAVDVTVTVTGTTSSLINSTPRNDPRGLWLNMDLGGRITDQVVVTFTFSWPVTDLLFSLKGIDQEQVFSNYQDRIAIEGFDVKGKRAIPSVGYAPFYARVTDGDSLGTKIVTGIREDDFDSTSTSVSYRGSAIKTLRLTYSSGTNVRNGLLTAQSIFISNFSWANIVPVNFIYFRGKSTNNKNLLEWATATEFNSDKFVVQRSTNLKDFSDLGDIKSAGDSRQRLDYNFTDEAPLPGINYYRLKQLDKDGTSGFSKTIAISSDTDDARFVIYPNPSNGRNIQLQFDNLDLEGIHLRDMLGREIAFEVQSNNNNSLTISPKKTLTTGAYFVTYQTLGKKPVTQKLIVQE